MKPPFDIEHRGQFQRGLVTKDQLSGAGASRQHRRTLVEHGILTPVRRGVYRAIGAPLAWKQDLLAACLAGGPDAVASHRAAALVWDLIDPPAPVEITVPYEIRRLAVRAVRHRSQTLRQADRVVRDGIPVTAPARTLLDLGAVAPAAVPGAMERCLLQGLLTTAALWRILADAGGPGVRGVRPLRRALEQRALGDAKPESLLEVVLADVLARTGVAFDYQVPVALDGSRYVLDFAVPSLLLGCEADGLSVHGSRAALDSDLVRQNRLVRHGWMILRYTHTRLKGDRRAVRDEVINALRQRQRQRRTLPVTPTL